MINNKYKLLNKIGEGCFGAIYKAQNCRTREEVAIKIEPIATNLNLLKNESKIYQYLLGTPGIPEVKWYGKDTMNYYMVIPLFGKSLDQFLTEKQAFSLKLTLKICCQILYLLKVIHEKGIIHRDIKPDNFLLGQNSKLFLIDFGLCKTYIKNDEHIEMTQTSGLIGSRTFASINSHKHNELSRRDDLESLCYMLIYFYLGKLPWREDVNLSDTSIINQKKDIINYPELPEIFKKQLIYIRNLEFKETPKYELFIHECKKEIEQM
jgi:serine/threonine protein kinase